MHPLQQVPILYVEDDENDVLLLQHAFQRADIANPVSVVRDGQAAMEYLAGLGAFANRQQHPLPGLVLLDLKLPRKMGLEVLQWIREQPALRKLPVIMLTSSSQDHDVGRAFDLGANAFLVKPAALEILADMCQALKHFWLIYNHPPPECGAPPPTERPLSPPPTLSPSA